MRGRKPPHTRTHTDANGHTRTHTPPLIGAEAVCGSAYCFDEGECAGFRVCALGAGAGVCELCVSRKLPGQRYRSSSRTRVGGGGGGRSGQLRVRLTADEGVIRLVNASEPPVDGLQWFVPPTPSPEPRPSRARPRVSLGVPLEFGLGSQVGGGAGPGRGGAGAGKGRAGWGRCGEVGLGRGTRRGAGEAGPRRGRGTGSGGQVPPLPPCPPWSPWPPSRLSRPCTGAAALPVASGDRGRARTQSRGACRRSRTRPIWGQGGMGTSWCCGSSRSTPSRAPRTCSSWSSATSSSSRRRCSTATTSWPSGRRCFHAPQSGRVGSGLG